MSTEHSGERLRKQLSTQYLSPTEFARVIGVSTQVLNNWFVRGIPGTRVLDVARALNADPNWLQHGTATHPGRLVWPSGASVLSMAPESNAEMLGPMDVWDDETPLDDDEVYVPFLKEVELSAGSGRTQVEPSHNKKLRFGKMTLRRQNVQPSEAVCVTASGNSMEPVLPGGSTVGVDQGSTTVVDGKMYALNHSGQLRVKVLYRLPGGGIRMRSYNRDEHPDEEYTAEQLESREIVVIGKVFWYSVLL